MKPPRWRKDSLHAFTLVELLVAIAVLGLMVALVGQMVVSTSFVFQNTGAEVDAFEAGREAFGEMTKNISQATLNPSWQYDKTSAPTIYQRSSNLQFICGQASTLIPGTTYGNWVTHAIFFQAPLGYTTTTYTPTAGSAVNDGVKMPNALNVVGYGIQFGSDASTTPVSAASRPAFLPNSVPLRWRYRLIELCQTSISFSIYARPPTTPPLPETWYGTPLIDGVPSTHVLAENVVALIIQPQTASTIGGTSLDSNSPITPTYAYDSFTGKITNLDNGAAATVTVNGSSVKIYQNQLPPIVQVTIVAIDEPGAARLQAANGTTAPDLGLTSTTTLSPASPFTAATKYQTDLATLEKNLQKLHLNYRVFSTAVTLPQAKWNYP